MITGTFDIRRGAIISLTIRDVHGNEETIDAMIDTGFNGALTLPASEIARLELPWRTRGSALIADGSIDRFDIHSAVVVWDGSARKILVETTETIPLIGLRLLQGSELRMQVVKDGCVVIERLP